MTPEGMSFIPAGPFQMGNNSYSETDGPEHTVDVSAIYMGQTEITYGEWRVVKEWADGIGYSFDNEGAGNGDNYPVTNINWYDVVKWSNAKSERDGLTPVYYTDPGQTEWSVYRTGKVSVTNAMVNWNANGYRLPTKAEWEKAARGNRSGFLYPNGDTLTADDANFGSEEGAPGLVKSYAPNGYRLYDMAGNVFEWCWDRGVDGNIPEGEEERSVRGGSWYNPAEYCRVSRGFLCTPTGANYVIGFRMVRRAAP